MQAKAKAERLTAELKLRLPEPLRKKIETAAKLRFDGKGHSINQEMIDRLDRSFGRGLLEEILVAAYGPTSAESLIEANRNGMLKIRDEDIERMLQSLRKFLVAVQKGEAAK
jgi:hypothetical protein